MLRRDGGGALLRSDGGGALLRSDGGGALLRRDGGGALLRSDAFAMHFLMYLLLDTDLKKWIAFCSANCTVDVRD